LRAGDCKGIPSLFKASDGSKQRFTPLPVSRGLLQTPVRFLGVFLCAFLWGPLPTSGQVSPGPLSRAHAFLNGPTQCTQCHGIAIGKAQLKCLGCHAEILQRLAQNRGFHARVLSKGASGKDCVPCHSEHNGADFNLVRWEPSLKQFDHSKTGYPLEGKHAALDCKQCHNPGHISAAERRTIQVKDLSRTFLGLSQDCLSCHTDIHRGQLGKDCQSCHTLASWKGAAQFEHAKTKYPLTGAHEKVACQKCHVAVAGPRPYVKYVGLSFQSCTPCHSDPHRGTFTKPCQACHTTASWTQVRTAVEFDHSKTKFPLLGKHEAVACAKCHRHADFGAPVAHAKCADCHTPDPHRGQFNGRKSGGECAECHNEKGFTPSLFTVALHAGTQYPLEGQHAKVACAKCHLPKGVDTLFKIKDTQCAACHADVHKGQFSGPPHNNRCEDCHNVRSFHSVKFTPAQHEQTRFPLMGAHIAVPCVECHKAEGGGGSAEPVRYRFEDRSCTACHQDPHEGQFAKRMATRRRNGSLLGCEACHTLASWTEISGFDHSTTSFPLTGAHRTVACIACHRPENLKTSLRGVNFKAAPTICHDCHEDPHGGQFYRAKAAPQCTSCHNTLRWKPSLFNHETGTTFSLKGAHQNVPCGLCHKLFRQVNGRRVVFYKPTARECVACHG
jgi:hypothetical protein